MFGVLIKFGVLIMQRNFDPHEFQLNVNRRAFLGRASQGVGLLALASLIHPGHINELPISDSPFTGSHGRATTPRAPR